MHEESKIALSGITARGKGENCKMARKLEELVSDTSAMSKPVIHLPTKRRWSGERGVERKRDRQTDRQAGRQTDREKVACGVRVGQKTRKRQTDRQTNKQTDRDIDRVGETKRGFRGRDRQTDRPTKNHYRRHASFSLAIDYR